MKSLIDNLNKVVLDIRYLEIVDVKDEAGSWLNYEILDPNPNLGNALSIDLKSSKNKDEEFKITVSYLTTENGLSLNWLDPP